MQTSFNKHCQHCVLLLMLLLQCVCAQWQIQGGAHCGHAGSTFHKILKLQHYCNMTLSPVTKYTRSGCFSVDSCINGKESSLTPTLRLENLANVSTEFFSLLQGKSEEYFNIYSCTLLRICHWVSLKVKSQ